MGFMRSLVGWKAYAAVGGVAAIAAAVVTWQVTSWQKDARYDRLVASNAVAMQAYADLATAAESRERNEETRRQEEKDRIEDETRKQIAAADDAARRAGAERDRLRAALASYTARQRGTSTDPGAVGVRPGVDGSDAIGLLAELFGRADDTAGDMAKYADALRAAGSACERQFNSLKPGTTP